MFLKDICIQTKCIYCHLSSARKKQVIWLCILMLMSLVAETASIGAILPFLAVLTDPEILYLHPLSQPLIEFLNLHQSSDLLLAVTVVFCVAVSVAGIVRFSLLYFQASLSRAIGVDFSVQAYERTLYQPFSFHVLNNSSEIMAGTAKAAGLVGSFIQPIFALVSALLVVIGVFLALIAINPAMALSALFSFGFIYCVILFMSKHRAGQNSQVIAMYQGKVNKVTQEGLGGIRDVLIDGAQPLYVKMYRESITPLQMALASNQIIAAGPRFGVEVLGMILIASLAYIFQSGNHYSSGELLSGNSSNLFSTLPALGALALGAQRLLPLLQQIYQSLINIKGSQASTKDAIRMLNQYVPLQTRFTTAETMKFNKSIRLRNVSFRYDSNGPYILHNINLEIPKGSVVGIMGQTGSGKSTLVDIIMGLLVPSDGDIAIDDEPITEDKICSWQKNISHVPQSIFLSDGSITENIAMSVLPNQIDMMRVLKSAKQAQILRTIEGWRDGFNTLIGERGVRLSGGQRQRLGIARALYKNTNLIIFDEATSALDNETELDVMHAIETLRGEVTILIVAHRTSTLKNCDFVVELVDGKIKSLGLYKELIN